MVQQNRVKKEKVAALMLAGDCDCCSGRPISSLTGSVQNRRMKRILKWLLLVGLVFLLVFAIAIWVLQRWIGTEDFKARAEREASTALGVAVKLARIDVALWPLPAVAVEGVQVQTQPSLTLERLEVRPDWKSLIQGRLELASVLVRRATLPQVGIDALLAALQAMTPSTHADQGLEAKNSKNIQYIPARMMLDNVTWVSPRGVSMTLMVDARLSALGLPHELSIKVLKGRLQGANAMLQRHGDDWTLSMAVGGGTVKGAFQLRSASPASAEYSFNGQLQTRAVELAALTSTPQTILSGALDADTTLSARMARVGALADVLQTQSTFTVGHAVLHGIDLARAVKTVGLSRGGETRLDTLAGQVVTRGRALQLSNLVASSGVLSASGNVAVAPSRALSGRVNVDLAASALGGAVSVPLVLGGTLDAPEVTLTRGALIGAAIGTAVMPGVGTGAGVSIGDKLGTGLKKLFGK